MTTAARRWPGDPADFVRAYLDAWNAADVDRVIDAWHVPSVLHTAGEVIAHPDGPSRRTFLGSYVESTRDALASGARWTCPTLDVRPLGADAAMATANWVFTLGDGTVTEDYLDTYLLVRVEGRWFILGDAIHAPEPAPAPSGS